MMPHQPVLEKQLRELWRWEQQKRRENLLIAALFYAVLANLLFLPVAGWLPDWFHPLYLTPLFFGLMGVGFLAARPWHPGLFVRTLHELDKRFHLQERVITAWEIVRRGCKKASEGLVLEEAAAGLQELRPKEDVKRQFDWHAYGVVPLSLILLLAVWLDFGARPEPVAESRSLAEELESFARDLEEKAKEQRLRESERMAAALHRMAREQLRGELSERDLGRSLGNVVDSLEERIQGLPQAADFSWPRMASDTLQALRQRLRSLRDQFASQLPEQRQGGRLDELNEFLPMDRQFGSTDNMSADEVRKLLDQLEQDAGSELDRRSLAGTRQFLMELLLKNPAGRHPEGFLPPGRRQGRPQDAETALGSRPGDQKGRDRPVYDPLLQARVRSHLKGLLGEGKSRGFTFSGEATPNPTKVFEDEVVVQYERQVEEELASERIPGEFKETIKQYFLALGMTHTEREE